MGRIDCVSGAQVKQRLELNDYVLNLNDTNISCTPGIV